MARTPRAPGSPASAGDGADEDPTGADGAGGEDASSGVDGAGDQVAQEAKPVEWPRTLDVYNHSGHSLDFAPTLVISAGGHQQLTVHSAEEAEDVIGKINEFAEQRGFQPGQIVFQGN